VSTKAYQHSSALDADVSQSQNMKLIFSSVAEGLIYLAIIFRILKFGTTLRMGLLNWETSREH
jgi:hypothetical protein